MGLLPEQLLDMPIWMFNAYARGYEYKQADTLALEIKAAYYCAYWSGWTKGHKKSLDKVIKEIYKPLSKSRKKLEPIDVEKVSKEFEKVEALRKYGWYQN